MNNFINAVHFTMDNVYLKHKEMFFKQINGCALGSPSFFRVIAEL